jgi:hypothetical protein
MQSKVFFQAVQGLWSPIAQAYSYVVCEEFDSYMDAKKWAQREGKSGDPTLALLEVRSKVLWRSSEAEKPRKTPKRRKVEEAPEHTGDET